MSALNSEDRELLDLLAQHFAGELTEETKARLQDRLRADAAARQLFRRYALVVAGIHWELTDSHRGQLIDADTSLPTASPANAAESPVTPSPRALSPPPHLPVTRSALAWSVLAASLLFAAYFVGISWDMLGKKLAQGRGDREQGTWKSEIQNPKSEIEPVATITASEDAVWSPDSEIKPFNPRPQPGAKWSDPRFAITPGQPLSITSGLVELQLKQGATLTIEGPAKWSIDGDNQATFKHGKLFAKVPQKAIGFVLATPRGSIVDLGTEFGVEITSSDITDVHVLLGKVEVKPTGPGNPSTVRLSAGQAIRIDARDSTLTKSIPVNRKAFAIGSSFRAIQPPLVRWREASERIRRDPDLIAYYDFERSDAVTSQLVNRAIATAGKLDGIPGADGNPESVPTWTTDGRWRNKGALYFTVAKPQFVRVADSPLLAPGDQLTIAAWVRPDQNFSHGVVVAKRSQEKTGYQLGLFGNFSDPTKSRRIDYEAGGAWLLSDAVVPPGDEWMFLAVTQDRSQVTFYFNGQLAGSHTTTSRPESPPTGLLVGRDFEQAGNTFPGAIDELLIYRRVLSKQEIASLYTSGKP